MSSFCSLLLPPERTVSILTDRASVWRNLLSSALLCFHSPWPSHKDAQNSQGPHLVLFKAHSRV